MAVAMMASQVRAETISNTASVRWTMGAATFVRYSNRVDVEVSRPVQTSILETYQFSGKAGAEQMTVPQTICRGSGGDQAVTLDNTVFAGMSTSPASVERTAQIRAGKPLIFGVASSADNRDPRVIDTFSLTFTTPAGDEEVLVLHETAVDSGLFTGMIRTTPAPAQPVRNNCELSLLPGDGLQLGSARVGDGEPVATTPVNVLIDPFGIVFDSASGEPVQGVRVTMVNADTGAPAAVFGDDGAARYPSSVITGETVTDSSGRVYTFPSGDYRFPFAAPGRYRLLVEPPAPYSSPSRAAPDELASLLRPDGLPFTVVPGSYSQVFVLDSPEPVRIDFPIDRPGQALRLRKSASVAVAVPGDAVQYRITVSNDDPARRTSAITISDRLPDSMRLKPNSIRYNGKVQPYTVSADGHDLSIVVPPLPVRGSGVVSYLLEVRPDAAAGQAMNRAQARDSRGTTSAVADATVRIARDTLADRMTIIGRITDGGCAVDPDAAKGIGGIRVMLEDGSYAVTDPDGRYHFEGVIPGTHVVQMDPSTLGTGLIPADCTRNARSAGSAISRFAIGQGGSLVRIDFRAAARPGAAPLAAISATVPGTAAAPGTTAAPAIAPPGPAQAAPATDAAAAGAEIDWLAGQGPGIAWLFPAPDHNPRTRAVRVAIKHGPGQSIALYADGKAVPALSFDGTRKSADGQVSVSLWRALDIGERDTVFTAEVRNADGSVAEKLSRTVHFANAALHAELVREKSVLVADGVTRPVIAVRMTDRDGKPVHHGLVGDFSVPAPYAPAVEADAQAVRQLAGLESARPVWRVKGDEGIAYIELEPTTASGGLSITLPFRDAQVTRTQRIETWLTPGNRPWTIVGFAEGTTGFNTLKGNLERTGKSGDDLLTSGRIALYAAGRITGKWLLTLAYDSNKKEDQTRFGGIIDPQAYYTIYADRSVRRFDAASVRKLYVRLERPQFYALFGDYETGMAETQLTRYVRSFNGVKAQYRNENVAASAFASDTPFRHRREEIQGNGLSGPYALAARDILANSERITIETRDRLRSNRIVDSRTFARHIDYDIDYVTGTIRFREPVLSRSSNLDPQIIVADYEVDGVAQRVVNAGGRAAWTNGKKTLSVGTSAIHDEDEGARTNVGGVDVRYSPNAATEVRAEIAVSDRAGRGNGNTGLKTGTSTAWLVEAEHHGSRYDLLAYAREQAAGYGVGQLNNSETGTRKFGADGRLRITPDLSFIASGWREIQLGTNAARTAGSARVEYRGKAVDLRAGVVVADDTLSDGRRATSTIAQLGATKKLFNNRLELDAQSEFALGKSKSIDFPTRQTATARLAVTSDVTLIGSYEIASGENIDARTARVGFDLKPWTGGRILATANRQTIAEYGPRSFAAYGLAQSLPIGKRWTVDFTLDGNRTLSGIDPARVLNPAQPVASGGFLGTDGTLTEDFTAVTGGATYRGDRWSWNGRAEVRAGETTDRYGITSSMLRSLGEGRALGGTLSWFKAESRTGQKTEAATLAVSWANHPDDSRLWWLQKLELRSDAVSGVTEGQPGPIGGAPSLVTGSATSKRIVNSLSVNWSPVMQSEGRFLGRSEFQLFWGSRYVFDRIDADDLEGWSNMIGADARVDLSETFDLGLGGSVRESNGGNAISYAGGPSVGVTPFRNGYVTLGYNLVGFYDRDYVAERYTRSGPFVTMRFKFDQNSLASLGLGNRR